LMPASPLVMDVPEQPVFLKASGLRNQVSIIT
jgi:hypothetical protein